MILGAGAASAAAALLPRRTFAASKAKLRIGLLLPYSGTYAALGNNITDAMKVAAQEHGGKLGGNGPHRCNGRWRRLDRDGVFGRRLRRRRALRARCAQAQQKNQCK